MSKANLEIKNLAKANNVYLWQIAEALGIADCNFSKMMRKEFDSAMKVKIRNIIFAIAEEQEA